MATTGDAPGGVWVIDTGSKISCYVSDATAAQAINHGHIESLKKRLSQGHRASREASIQWFGADGHCDATDEFIDHVPVVPWVLDSTNNPDAAASWKQYLFGTDKSDWSKRESAGRAETKSDLKALRDRLADYRENNTHATPCQCQNQSQP